MDESCTILSAFAASFSRRGYSKETLPKQPRKELPHDVLRLIFDQLDPVSLVRAARVNKSWNACTKVGPSAAKLALGSLALYSTQKEIALWARFPSVSHFFRNFDELDIRGACISTDNDAVLIAFQYDLFHIDLTDYRALLTTVCPPEGRVDEKRIKKQEFFFVKKSSILTTQENNWINGKTRFNIRRAGTSPQQRYFFSLYGNGKVALRQRDDLRKEPQYFVTTSDPWFESEFYCYFAAQDQLLMLRKPNDTQRLRVYPLGELAIWLQPRELEMPDDITDVSAMVSRLPELFPELADTLAADPVPVQRDPERVEEAWHRKWDAPEGLHPANNFWLLRHNDAGFWLRYKGAV